MAKDEGKVYIVVEDCYNDETQNVACFDTEEEAKAFCDRKNVIARENEQIYWNRFSYEEWLIGEIIETYL